MTITDASDLSNDELTAEVSRLALCEREATVALIVHLAEFDARRLYEPGGFQSLFQYCQTVLHLSEDAIYNRIATARTARRYPVIVDMLLARSLSPTTVRMLARHLTPENHEALLGAASGKGKQGVEELLARHYPQPDVTSSIRKIAVRSRREAPAVVPPEPAPGDAAAVPAAPTSGQADASRESDMLPLCPAAPPTRHPVVQPLSPERYEIRFTASAEMREKLRLAQDLLSHAVPTGDIAQVFDRALTLLVDDLCRKKFAATDRPRPSKGQSDDSANMPAAVKRAVWVRDGGRCAFVAKSGRRCAARRFIEFHHVVPRGAGGKPTVENAELRCRSHNGHEAELFYGPEKRYRRPDGVRAAPAIQDGRSFRNDGRVVQRE